jgi:LPXTG-motif cell wall-anchored protein
VTSEDVKLVKLDGDGNWEEVTSVTNVDFTAASEGKNATATVSNEKGVALPKTGGSGTGMITILGSILILLGTGVLLLRRRRESL